MKRESRYTVMKNSDLTILTTQQHNFLDDILDAIHHHRQNTGCGPLKCVVVESGWPEYEPTWGAIERRVSDLPAETITEEKLLEACRKANFDIDQWKAMFYPLGPDKTATATAQLVALAEIFSGLKYADN